MDGAGLKSFSCETGRLQLRPLAEGDELLFHALYTDPGTMRFIKDPLTPANATRQFHKIIHRQGGSALAGGFLALVEKDAHTPLGICATSHYDPTTMRLEVGLMLLPLGRRLGVGREALTALVGLAFEETLVDEVYARSAAGNTAAKNLLARVGFRSDGIAKGDRQKLAMWAWSMHRSRWLVSKSTNFRG